MDDENNFEYIFLENLKTNTSFMVYCWKTLFVNRWPFKCSFHSNQKFLEKELEKTAFSINFHQNSCSENPILHQDCVQLIFFILWAETKHVSENSAFLTKRNKVFCSHFTWGSGKAATFKRIF